MPDSDFDIAQARTLASVPHGFFGSANGAHQFGFGGPGDAEDVRALRKAAARTIVSGCTLAAPHQVHSSDVVTVEEAWDDIAEGRPVADALVTNRSGIALAIVTADCAPVLFADASASVIGAAHAGWRGAQGGVVENTISAMEDLGAARGQIVAAIGPTIAQRSYEVDAPFREHFEPSDEHHFAAAPKRDGKDRWLFDLPGYIAEKLRKSGVRTAEILDLDTYGQPHRYHSYRRSRQAGDPDYGRQISMIALG